VTWGGIGEELALNGGNCDKCGGLRQRALGALGALTAKW
jgi:hypothetical protein